jgi:hypothetical protein
VKRAWLGPGVAVLLLSSCGGQSGAAPARPSPTRVVDYGPPPAGVPLLYVRDPARQSWLIGFDWQGQPRGTIELASNPGFTQAAPDGAGFLAPDGTYLDRLGAHVPGPTAPGVTGKAAGLWADDNRHLCFVAVDFQTYAWTLSTQLPGEAVRPVALIAQDQGLGQSGITAVACTFKNDLAILVRTSIWWPSEIWVVRLTDGKVVSHHSYIATDLVTVLSTRDGSYIAESSSRAQSMEARGAANTTIRRVSDWSGVAPLSPSDQVLQVSGDGSLVLVTTQSSASVLPSHLAVIDWRTGRAVWSYDGPESLYRSVASPDGREFAVALRAPTRYEPAHCGAAPYGTCHEVSDPLNDILIVHGDGTTTAITGRYEPLW